MIWIELVILLACILVGARLGGIALGTVAGIGLVVFVFGFGLPPGGPPGVVLGMIIAVITALATMQAAGGLDYLVTIAEKVMRRRPQHITFIAPLVTYLLVFAAGTTHVIYALLPVIAEVARKADIRPERPLSISVIAGFNGALASPISAVTVAMLGALEGREVSLPRLLAITIPSTLLAVVVGALSVAWRGAKPSEDEACKSRLASPAAQSAEAPVALEGRALRAARASMLLFLGGLVAVVLLGLFPSLRPVYEVVEGGVLESDQVGMGMAIMIVMIAVAGLTMVLFGASPKAALEGTIMRSGITAFICIVGVAWLGSSFFEGNRTFIVGQISGVVQDHPGAFAVGMFLLSTIMFSASATAAILMPVGVVLDIPTPLLVAFYPLSSIMYFLPAYGTLLAAVSFDQTGSTRIGRFLLNHSFMRPGLVATATAIVAGLALSSILPL